MIKVECVSCSSPYDVDERRVPDLGMKMRCPKCGTSFLVGKDGSTTAVAQTALGTGPANPVPPPAIAPPAGNANLKKTLVGQQAPAAPAQIDLPKPVNFKGTMVGLPAALPPPSAAAPGPIALVPPPTAASRAPKPDLSDLPAVKPPAKPAVPRGSLAPPAIDSKSVPARPTAPGPAAPAGLFGGAAAAPTVKAGGAASAFGTPNTGTLKRTMLGNAPLEPDSGADLPALKPKTPAAASPRAYAPGAAPAPIAELDLDVVDLPAPKLEVDLPAPKLRAKPAAFTDFGEVDLPAPKLELDLPAPKHKPAPSPGFGELDLPAPKLIADLPAPKLIADLPAPKLIADLPARRGQADLPAVRAGGAGVADLPTPKLGGGFGDLDLPVPKPGSPQAQDESSFGDIELPDLPPLLESLPAPAFGDIELPPPRAAAVIAPKEPTYQGVGIRAPVTQDESSFGDLNMSGDSLPPSLMGGDDESSFGDVNPGDDMLAIPGAPRTPRKMDGGSIPPALRGDDDDDEVMGDGDLVDDSNNDGDGDELGEVDLPGDDEESEEDMEFGIAGGEGEEGFSLPPEVLRRQRGDESEGADASKGKRAIHMVAAVAVVLTVLGGVGAGLGFTDYGFFGIYYLERYLPEAGDPSFTREAIARAEKTASSDTYRDVRRSLALLGEARHKAGLSRELMSRSLMHEAFFLTRFGADANSSSHIAALLLRLQERHNVAPGMDLALAADAARRQAWGEVDPLLAKARAQAPNEPYVDLVAGEVGLRQGKLAEAEKAFSEALKHGGGARAQWGLARVALARPGAAAQKTAVEETLQLSPLHVEARIAQARILWSEGKEDRAIQELRQALGLEAIDDQFLWTSKPALAQGYSVLGYVHEARGRLHLARKAYDDALAADPYLVEALLGAGRVMLREKRFNDALARFESALNIAQKSVNPVALSGRKADVEARLGQGRAQLALDRAPDAKGVLSVLMNENPNDAEIILAVGQAEEALTNKISAETLYKKSIDLAPTSFAGYLALSQFYFKQNEADKASETLNQAAAKVEENAEMRRMLGQSELARNRVDSAVHEFKRAVVLDPQDLDARFGLAIAQRKSGDLATARMLFDEIGARDAQYPGLTLERGQLFEAEGEYVKAADSYKLALAKDANDTGMMLRLGAAQVEAGLLDEAEQTLARVVREVPNSAEAEYFIGRIAFARGRGPDALTHFDRALSLDNTQPYFHLYAARAALSMANLGRTLEEVDLTMKRDATIGDTYWVRGIVRLRMGAVKDALKDLQRALVLKPSRYEAYAAIGECYDELRMLPQSIDAFHTALEKEPKNGEWWYKLGRVHLDLGQTGPANEAFKKSIQAGDAIDPAPYYLSEAYRLAGDIARGNNKKAAIALYERYLKLAPDGALDRKEVSALLRSWGIELED